ncbi:hypothetical protein C8Q80DRAFT_1184597 [Daedaleopsis nitida]|nr:hypothetical protein C8Q80DRAFT_1184597 [Daedaleopsis nitida]
MSSQSLSSVNPPSGLASTSITTTPFSAEACTHASLTAYPPVANSSGSPNTAPTAHPTRFAALWAWAKNGATDDIITFFTNNGAEIAALSVDTCSVLGVGEGGASSLRNNTPWLLKMLSPLSSDYHLEKGDIYLKEAFALLDQDGADMQPALAQKLLKWQEELVEQQHRLIDDPKRGRRACRAWKHSTNEFRQLTKRSSDDARRANLRAKIADRHRQASSLGNIPESRDGGGALGSPSTSPSLPSSDHAPGPAVVGSTDDPFEDVRRIIIRSCCETDLRPKPQ